MVMLEGIGVSYGFLSKCFDLYSQTGDYLCDDWLLNWYRTVSGLDPLARFS